MEDENHGNGTNGPTRGSPDSPCLKSSGSSNQNTNNNNTTTTNNNNNNNNNNKEQDRFLPIANVGRIMKKVIPGNGKISKDAKETVQECVSEFISFVTGEASDKCQREKRKTINGDDIIWAITTLDRRAEQSSSRHLLISNNSNMFVSWRQKCLLFTLLLTFIVLSQGSRLPKQYWEQMLPKKLPAPSSSPSKGTNVINRSSSTMMKADRSLPSSDGKDGVIDAEVKMEDDPSRLEFCDFYLRNVDPDDEAEIYN
ncbi:hypothetical protein Tsubulata_048855 [Turnera subulata]|uniref:Transcription factor CBF/NF-Y/archaeal histone domain-containing protein n=1 Tax=Turnera subulata TaxID=218843 RepID=A0A9Q0GGU7_9ROSI|nr:hypothetical protein Tsubulata_048855 [Turnera subulata]